MSDNTITSTSTMDKQRQRSGRVRMLSLLALCAAPVIASYLAYYVLRPQGQTNYGDLIQPQRVMPAKTLLTTLKDKPVALEQLRGNWLLVSVDFTGCDSYARPWVKIMIDSIACGW
jgi:cytochrome oxidase Cu insertion factor (SCO1/SenC/PrrC family)